MRLRMLAALAAAMLASGTAFATMDCCTDGSCACCSDMKKDGDKAAAHDEHHHQH